MPHNSPLILFIASVLGLLAHAFKKASERNKAQEPKYSIINYFKDEANGIACNVICQIVVSYYSSGVTQIENMPEYLAGCLYFGLGYMGDSAFPSLLEMIPSAIDKLKSVFGLGKKPE